MLLFDTNKKLTEDNFIENLKAGKSTAYNQLLEQYQHQVFMGCLSFVPNKEDAEDIAQEVFLEVFKSVNKFKGDAKLSTWIYRITTNKCLEFIRKKNTKKRFAFMQRLSGETTIENTKYFTEFNHPGVLMEHKESTATIYKAINLLPENQRVVFTLAKIDGKSYQEIVEITGKSLSSVEGIMFRAKKKLQKKLSFLQKKNN